MDRVTEDLWRELPRGMWFVANAALRTVHTGRRFDEVEVVVVYDLPKGPVAIGTVFRTKDWADREELAPYELMLQREGVPLTFGEAQDDTLQAHGNLLFRTRFVIGEPAIAAEADVQDSQAEPDLFVHQIEERLSRL